MLLYSTNCFLKYYIQRNYYGDRHYVWCSDNFDSSKVSIYSAGSQVPASSNPFDIYKTLTKDVQSSDRHSAKIIEQQASLKKLAASNEASGLITTNVRDEIIYLADNSDFKVWRPLIYVIPKGPIASRLSLVPISKRAGNGPEYIISDLDGSEFQILDLL